jgi:hypothetical protein
VFDARGVSFVAVTQQFINGPLPSARPFWRMLRGDDPVSFIYSASDMGKGFARALMEIRAPCPQSTPRPRLGQNCCQVWKVPVRPVRHQLSTMACAMVGWH